MAFFFEVLVTGLMVGIMYSLVALGFVLIYKASDVFNMAQGAMSLFVVAYLVVFVVLKPLVARPPLMLFMATFGVAYLLEGIGQSIWGTQAKGLELGIPELSFEVAGIFMNTFDIFFAGVAAVLVGGLVWFFQKTRTGRALRAVSDDHEAALSVGIPLLKAWYVTWVIAGIVATVAGVAWGTRLGVQFSLSLIALKALPVLIIGGIDSIPGAIIAGLIVGAGENLGEVFLGPYVGGGIQTFFPYLLALIVLYFKPYGLFGKEIIERV
jgi:branched-chain amino acid transport system permease protein